MFLDSMREHSAFPRWLTLLLALALAGNVLAWLTIGLLPDEAYYWVWSQRPELSYFDHPPLVAWLMWPFTALFGSDAAVIRLPAVLSWLVGAVLAYDLSRRIYRERRAGALAVLIWSSLPIVQVGFHIVTPDSPLIIFAWCTYYFAWRAVAERRPGLWLATGLCAGLALLGQYPGVLVVAGLFLALILSAEGRRQLARPWPWWGALLALLTFAPVVIWNGQHGWASFAFQFGHGVQQVIAPDPLKMLLLFLGGQLAVVMPWTFVAMVWASLAPMRWRHPLYGYGGWLFGIGFWLPLLVFGIAGLTADSGPNWPESAYVPGTVLLAGVLHGWLYAPARTRGRARPLVLVLVIIAVLSSLALVNLLRFPHWLLWLGAEHLPPQRTQLSQTYGWPQAGEEMRRLLAELEPAHPDGAQCKVITGYHASAGMVAWLLRAPGRVTTATMSRISQYRFWAEEEPLRPESICLYLDKYESEAVRVEDIPLQVDLGAEGRWRRVSLLEVTNPDLSLRWYAFYVPATP